MSPQVEISSERIIVFLESVYRRERHSNYALASAHSNPSSNTAAFPANEIPYKSSERPQYKIAISA